MAITTLDQLIAAAAAGRQTRIDWNKITGAAGYTAGRVYDLSRLNGYPVARTYSGTALTGVNMVDTDTGGLWHGGNVETVASAYKKALVDAQASTLSTTGFPGTLIVADYLRYYPGINMNLNTLQSFTNNFASFATVTCDSNDILTHDTPRLEYYTRVRFTTTGTLPTGLSTGTDYYVIYWTEGTCKLASSYANAVAGTAISITSGTGSGTHTMNTILPRSTSGRGVRAMIVPDGTIGANAHNISMAYMNEQGTTGRSLGATVAATVSAITPHAYHSGTAANNYWPLPLGGADAGMQMAESVTFSAAGGSAQTGTLILFKILYDIPLTAQYAQQRVDLSIGPPSLPPIQDGAALNFILAAGANVASSSSFMGAMRSVWG